MTIYDIVAQEMPAFADIYPYICDEKDETVEFLFMVDKLGLKKYELIAREENGTHVGTRWTQNGHKANEIVAHEQSYYLVALFDPVETNADHKKG